MYYLIAFWILFRVMNPELKGLVNSVFKILPACAFGNLANLTSFLFHFFGPGTYMMLDLGLMFEYYSFNHTASFELRKDKFTWQCLTTVTIAKSWYHPKIQSMLSIIHLFKCQELIFSLLLRTQICKNNLDILFRQITTFIKVCVAFVFGLQTL